MTLPKSKINAIHRQVKKASAAIDKRVNTATILECGLGDKSQYIGISLNFPFTTPS